MLKGFKTVIFNIVAAILPVLEMTDLTNVMDMNDEWGAAYAGIVAAGNIWLRAKTKTPIFEK